MEQIGGGGDQANGLDLEPMNMGIELDEEQKEIQRQKKYEEREYQQFLFETAKKENIIICLPTGCGKTFIAVELVKYYLEVALKDNKKIVFIATTVPLVNQQGRYLKDHIGSKHVGIVTGDMKPEEWSGEKWKRILQEYEIFSMTDQILNHAVERGHVKWQNVCLLIIDECHNATGSHPMSSLMGQYSNDPEARKTTRVLGLTATIVNGRAKTTTQAEIALDIQNVENRFNCRAITYYDYDQVLRCSTSAKMHYTVYNKPQTWHLNWNEKLMTMDDYINECVTKIGQMKGFLLHKNSIAKRLGSSTLQSDKQVFWNKKSPLDDFSKPFEDIKQTLQELGPYCAKLACLAKNAYFVHRRSKETRIENQVAGLQKLYDFIQMQFDLLNEQLDTYMHFMSVEGRFDEKDHIVDLISPKLKKLIHTLSKHSPTEDRETCGIIFCEKRMTSQMVCYYLQDLARVRPEFGFLRCSYAIGTSGANNPLVSSVAMRLQNEILEKFRSKQLNLLVATKVLEEGLDVPSCNFIIRFDPIVTFPSYVQSMGRARQRDADFYVFASSEKVDEEKKKVVGFQHFNLKLCDALKDNVEHPEKYFNDTDQVIDIDLNNKVPPFQPGPGPQKITAGSAIQIVYRYCEMLSSDRVSTLCPVSWYVEKKGVYQASVRLPPSACVKGVTESAWYDSKYYAKKAAFLEVCKKLHAKGVLHPETLLPYPGQLPVEVNKIIEELEGAGTSQLKTVDGKKVGSKTRTQWYPKKIPEVFQNCPKNSAEMKIYALEFHLESFFGNPELKTAFDFQKMPYLYGIVTSANLEMITDYLLFSRDGNFKVNIRQIGVSTFSAEQISSLQLFQSTVFSDKEMLNMKHPVLRQQTSEDSNIFIAPLRRLSNADKNNGEIEDSEIAWDLISLIDERSNIDYSVEISITERRQMSFDETLYKDALVIPCYTPKLNPRQPYYALSLDRKQSPQSEFESADFKNFVEYYDRKYNINIVHPQGPILIGKAVSKQLNFLVAKYDKWKMDNLERREAKFTGSVRPLIPELLRIHPLPGSLFIQAKLLPSALHRMGRLLLACEIRDSVAQLFNEKANIDLDENKKLLTKLDNDVSLVALPLLNNKSLVDPSLPSTSNTGSSGPSIDALISRDEQAFSYKRRLLWVEIEYIHPKKVTLTDLHGPEEEDDEEAMDIEDDEYNSPIRSPQDPLFDFPIEIPFQDFDTMRNNGDPMPASVMEAMTLANGRDYLSLEKLEMMGDSVLKLIVSLHIFSNFPLFNEGQLTSLRSRLISNRHLFIHGTNKKLGEYLAGSLFQPENCWLPIGCEIEPRLSEIVTAHDVSYSVFSSLVGRPAVDLSLPDAELSHIVADRAKNDMNDIKGKAPTHTTYTHSRIGDKSVADCVEALIGSYYEHGGLSGALRIMQWLGLAGPTPSGKSVPYSEIPNLPRINAHSPGDYRIVKRFLPFLHDIEDTLDYRFKNPWLAIEALTHPSYMRNVYTASYERLEFIGDAVLDFLVTHFIYREHMAESPGKLTDLRSALVNNVTFGALTVRYKFQEQLLHFSPALQRNIDSFAASQEKNGHKATGIFHLIGDQDTFVAEDVEVSKVLGDIFESLIGAVFVDSGHSLDSTWNVVYRLLKKEIDEFSKDVPINPIRKLYEQFPGALSFVDVDIGDEQTKAVKLRIKGSKKISRPLMGIGATKRNAKVACAKYALKVLNDKNLLRNSPVKSP